jgi:alpha-galactosidase
MVKRPLPEDERSPSSHSSANRPSANRRAGVSIISLNDQGIVRSIFREIGRAADAHQELRRQIFRQVAKSAKLQHMILEMLSENSEAQKSLLQELAKNSQLRRKFFVAAQEKNLRGTSAVRKKAANLEKADA